MLFKKLNILIVDDSEIIADRLVLLLNEKKTIRNIYRASGYGSALDLLSTASVNLAILDINLGGKSGIELLEWIKAEHPDIIVIMFTNNAFPYYRNLCKDAGAEYFLDKSTDFEMITDIIGSIDLAQQLKV